jgi:hypothetical protein
LIVACRHEERTCAYEMAKETETWVAGEDRAVELAASQLHTDSAIAQRAQFRGTDAGFV